MDFILNVVRALSMAQELPFFIALPIYVIAYAVAIWVTAKAVRAIKELWKK